MLVSDIDDTRLSRIAKWSAPHSLTVEQEEMQALAQAELERREQENFTRWDIEFRDAGGRGVWRSGHKQLPREAAKEQMESWQEECPYFEYQLVRYEVSKIVEA